MSSYENLPPHERFKPQEEPRSSKQERNEELFARFYDGWRYEQLKAEYGISKQRIMYIVKREMRRNGFKYLRGLRSRPDPYYPEIPLRLEQD